MRAEKEVKEKILWKSIELGLAAIGLSVLCKVIEK